MTEKFYLELENVQEKLSTSYYYTLMKYKMKRLKTSRFYIVQQRPRI